MASGSPLGRESAVPLLGLGRMLHRLRASRSASYHGETEIAGPLTRPWTATQPIDFRRVTTRRQRRQLTVLVTASMLASVAFLGWLLVASRVRTDHGVMFGVLAVLSFGCLITVEILRVVQAVAIWVFAMAACDPVPLAPEPGLRVAVLTTIVPDKEPIALAAKTLAAMRRLTYDGPVEVWILDEGDDPTVRSVAEALGVRHFSRKGHSEYNQPSGEFRARTKAGNHNAWRAEHERNYDAVAQVDPDHVPQSAFLERTLGYFRDPDVAYVVAPQVYGNARKDLVTHGAASQIYLFSGVVQRGGNGLGSPLLIGTNHLYRPSAWSQIGGYQDSIIEDHLTGLRVSATVNPATGQRWKGIYTPDILAIGEGPATWTDYFNQQKRWAYGIWEIVLHHSRVLLRRLTPRQRIGYLLVQAFYPCAAATWLFGNLATALYLLLGVVTTSRSGVVWGVLWATTMVLWFTLLLWLRQFNLAEHERRESGVRGMLISLFASPIYLAAAAAALSRRPLGYTVTAKGDLSSRDSPATFSHHLGWAAAAGLMLVGSARLGHDNFVLRLWGLLTFVASGVPPIFAACRGLTLHRRVAGEEFLTAFAEPLDAPHPDIKRFAHSGDMITIHHRDRPQ